MLIAARQVQTAFFWCCEPTNWAWFRFVAYVPSHSCWWLIFMQFYHVHGSSHLVGNINWSTTHSPCMLRWPSSELPKESGRWIALPEAGPLHIEMLCWASRSAKWHHGAGAGVPGGHDVWLDSASCGAGSGTLCHSNYWAHFLFHHNLRASIFWSMEHHSFWDQNTIGSGAIDMLHCTMPSSHSTKISAVFQLHQLYRDFIHLWHQLCALQNLPTERLTVQVRVPATTLGNSCRHHWGFSWHAKQTLTIKP